jgi:pyruvate,orthophosphate dikinase
VLEDRGIDVTYEVGTMIETPRAALVAEQLAAEADFFSFGTNDLTQTAFAMSRDDAEASFLVEYVNTGVLDHDPFTSLDAEGVGALMQMAVSGGTTARPGLETGICGEHGGDPASIAWCHAHGLDYVSCSPYRVPVARLAAAHAALDAS